MYATFVECTLEEHRDIGNTEDELDLEFRTNSRAELLEVPGAADALFQHEFEADRRPYTEEPPRFA